MIDLDDYLDVTAFDDCFLMSLPQGHTKEDCEVPDKCFNCREEGHTSADCPEPVKCRNCFKEGHQMADCPDPIRCTR